MDFPAIVMPPPAVLVPSCVDSIGLSLPGSGSGALGSAASATWITANKAYFYPFRLYDWATCYQLLFWVGATSNGNIDVGIYDTQGRLVVSMGTTAMSATVNTIQELNVTNTPIPPGDYLLAGACSSTSGTCFGVTNADEQVLATHPIYEMASALPLPDPATPVLLTEGSAPRWVIGAQFMPTF